VCIEKGDVIVFGLSSRKYRVEVDESKVRLYLEERNQQLQRGVSWGKVVESRSRSRSRSPRHKK
jgi:hypothetical protein